MKSTFPRPIVNLVKSVYIPHLRKKWKKHPLVQEWINDGLINDSEIDWLVLNWQKHNFPKPPPPKVKQLFLSKYAKEFGCKILVETGTYKGEMISAQLKNFTEIHSIELSDKYYQDALITFKEEPHVHLHKGDSGLVLPNLAPTLKSKTIYWLDGHYCGGVTAKSDVECPIYAELDAVFSSGDYHVVLVDDARDFVGKNDYPTIQELKNYLLNMKHPYTLEVESDIIKILPNNS